MPEGTDRYLVDQSDFGVRIEERFRALEQKVEEALRRNPLRDASMTDGALRILDAAGNQQVVIGKQSDGTYGIWSYDDAGNVVLKLDDNGLRAYDTAGLTRVLIGLITSGNYGARVRDASNGIRFSVENDGYKDPWLAQPWRNQQTPARVSTTSATFVDAWTSTPELINHLGVSTTAAWVTDAGTTGEVRLSCDGSASNTSAVAIAAASSGVQQFRWLHGATLGTGPTSFRLQVRRTGGAGSVHLDEPMSALTMADPDSCTATGL